VVKAPHCVLCRRKIVEGQVTVFIARGYAVLVSAVEVYEGKGGVIPLVIFLPRGYVSHINELY
jgi:hypothetical protein